MPEPTSATQLPRVPPPIPVPGWSARFPRLVHGITIRGPGAAEGPEFDLRIHGAEPCSGVLDRWELLREHTGMSTVVHSRQVHGRTVRTHRSGGEGLLLAPDADGHLTSARGVLLTVGLADCVPVFLAAPGVPAVGLLHAGWRGTAAGILETGIAAMGERFGATADELHVHLGASIGAESYEVGPEVFRALGRPEPSGPALLDLRGVLAERAWAAGVQRACLSRSSLDTRSDPRLFSHRAGDRGRHVAFLGIRGGDWGGGGDGSTAGARP